MPTTERTYETSRDCAHCGNEIPITVTYEISEGTVAISDVTEPNLCPGCGRVTDGPGGRDYMIGLRGEIKDDLRRQGELIAEGRRAKAAGTWA